ncbi:MAG: PRC and DUF2382 domain-containing protein [Actinomycetota bacterium]|nr:PRC and DUF2382 domain-containing protein [Actinomycetota bacterium]
MPDVQELTAWRGREVRDSSGDKIGTVEEIYLDEETGQPEWISVKSGLFGTKHNFVPVQGADAQGDAVSVPYEKSQVTGSPTVDADGELSQDEEARLYSHYGLDYGESQSDSGLPEGGMGTAGMGTAGTAGMGTGGTAGMATGGTADLDRDRTTDVDRDRTRDVDVGGSATTGRGAVGNDVSGPETDEAMTRSEEEIRIGTRRREVGRARLRKFIVTEPVQETVTVQHEEVHIEREPITDANMPAAMSGADLTEEEHEVTLTTEEAVVEKRVVPKERVRLDKDVVTEQQTISDEVRKEVIEADVPEGTTDRGDLPGGRDRI